MINDGSPVSYVLTMSYVQQHLEMFCAVPALWNGKHTSWGFLLSELFLDHYGTWQLVFTLQLITESKVNVPFPVIAY